MKTSTKLALMFGLGVLACGDSGAGGSSNAGGSNNGGAANGGNGGAANGGNGGAANGGNGGAANGGNGGAANGGNGGAANGGNGGAANGGAANGGAGGCAPDCGSNLCGDDGCNGSCGDCAPDELCAAGQCILAPSDLTSFFVSSVGNMSGDFGGLAGADMFCQQLAQAVSLGNKTWRAYLSTSNVNARDRIGTGPWFNSLGEQVASSVNALHTSGIAMNLMRDEFRQVPPAGEHDILTGSTQNGMSTVDTCDNWTSSAQFTPKGMVGHFDSPNPVNMFDNWNSTHQSNGCDAAGLSSTGGTARIYCFAL